MKYTIKEAIIISAIWSVIMTWVTFFSRQYDGLEYILACILTWLCGAVIAFAYATEKVDE